MAGNVKIIGDQVLIGTKKFTRKRAQGAQHAVMESAKAARDIHNASQLYEGSFKNGTGQYIEVHAKVPNSTGHVVCNALYDNVTQKPAGYIRIHTETGRSDSRLPNMRTSFYCLNADKKLVTFL